MNRVFADTFYFLALLNANDNAHAKAVAFTSSFHGKLVTTDWILTELADALAATAAGRSEFVTIRTDLIQDPNAQIVAFDSVLMDLGVQFYIQRPDKKWSLTDCISFLVMQQENVRDALTADHHFEQAGFAALLK